MPERSEQTKTLEVLDENQRPVRLTAGLATANPSSGGDNRDDGVKNC